jgi:hypothetical protein
MGLGVGSLLHPLQAKLPLKSGSYKVAAKNQVMRF